MWITIILIALLAAIIFLCGRCCQQTGSAVRADREKGDTLKGEISEIQESITEQNRKDSNVILWGEVEPAVRKQHESARNSGCLLNFYSDGMIFDSQQVRYGTDGRNPGQPYKEGQTFAGWLPVYGGGDKWMGTAFPVVSDRDCRAIFIEGRFSFEDTIEGRVCRSALKKVGCLYSQSRRIEENYYDCSSFVGQLYAEVGLDFSGTAAEEAEYLVEYGAEIEYLKIQPGDLLFYTRDIAAKRWQSIGHVAMYLGDGYIVHAKQGETGVIISPLDDEKPVICARPTKLMENLAGSWRS